MIKEFIKIVQLNNNLIRETHNGLKLQSILQRWLFLSTQDSSRPRKHQELSI